MIYSNIYPTPDQLYRIMPLKHNWSSAFRETVEYQTDVITSENGKEQRRAVRMFPRRTFEYTLMYRDEQKAKLDMFFDKPPTQLCIVPEEPMSFKLSANMPVDANTLRHDGVKDWFQANMMILLNDNGRCETRTIDGWNATTMFLSERGRAAFPAGTRVTAARVARINNAPSSTRLTNVAGTLSLSAELDPTLDKYAPGDDEQLFIGLREYLQAKANWGQAPVVQHSWAHEDIDYGHGAVKTYASVKFPSRTLKASYWRKGWKSSRDLIDFFCRMKGRNREFLLPSYEKAVPFRYAAAETSAILIDGLDFAYTYKDSSVYRRILIRKKDGTEIHRQVDYVEALPDTDTSVIWLTEPLPDTDIAPNDVFGIWWVTVARFATDRLDIDWITGEVAQFAFNMQNLENLDI